MSIRPISDSKLEALAEEHADNWRSFGSFADFTGTRHLSGRWTIHYFSNRDSGIVEQSNAAIAMAALRAVPQDDEDDPDFEEYGASHFAVGYVDGAKVRVYREDGSITPTFRKLAEILSALDDYPILNDDEDVSEREWEDSINNIRSEGEHLVRARASKGWPYEVARWLDENESREMECKDGGGAYPSEDAIDRALRALKLRGRGSLRYRRTG